MNTSLQVARTVLGNELIKAIRETSAGDEKAFKEMLDEALQAFKIIRKEIGWRNTIPSDQE